MLPRLPWICHFQYSSIKLSTGLEQKIYSPAYHYEIKITKGANVRNFAFIKITSIKIQEIRRVINVGQFQYAGVATLLGFVGDILLTVVDSCWQVWIVTSFLIMIVDVF